MLRLSKPNLGREEVDAIAGVLASGQLVQGEQVARFESEFASYSGARHAVAVSSGTAALHLSLLAAGVTPGDAVLVPNFTFIATANVVSLVGATPVLVDVDPTTYCIDLDLLEHRIETWRGDSRLAAVIPVLEFGCPVDRRRLDALASRHALVVVEDAACAAGTRFDGKRVGPGEQPTCFSFHPRKTLTTGEGGMILTDDGALAETLRLLRSHGLASTARGIECLRPGFNYRMTDVAGALGRVQLTKLESALDTRRELAGLYTEQLQTVAEIALPRAVEGHSWQTYMICLDPGIDRGHVIRDLRARGIETNFGAQSIADQPGFRHLDGDALEISRRLNRSGLALPFCESYGRSEVERVVSALRDVLR